MHIQIYYSIYCIWIHKCIIYKFYIYGCVYICTYTSIYIDDIYKMCIFTQCICIQNIHIHSVYKIYVYIHYIHTVLFQIAYIYTFDIYICATHFYLYMYNSYLIYGWKFLFTKFDRWSYSFYWLNLYFICSESKIYFKPWLNHLLSWYKLTFLKV